MKFVDEKGNKYDKAYINGYDVGGRILEGVIFEITLKGEEIEVQVNEEDKDYFHQLNEKMWIENVKTHCIREKEYYGDYKCSIPVWIEGRPPPIPKKKGKVLSIMKAEDLLEALDSNKKGE